MMCASKDSESYPRSFWKQIQLINVVGVRIEQAESRKELLTTQLQEYFSVCLVQPREGAGRGGEGRDF
jgi:hypothetical protein